MQQLHSDLWITDSPLRFLGLEVGARMAVVRLPGPKLLLHSPIAAAPDLVSQVKALGEYAGWDGSFSSIAEGKWQPTPCQFSVEENEHKGKVTYRIAWLNGYDSPVGGKGLSPDEAKKLQTQHGASMRALIGNAKRNAAPPTGAPQTPPTQAPEQAPPLTAEQAKIEAETVKDDVPFRDPFDEAREG